MPEATPAIVTPTALATELGIDPKRLRAYLRSAHTRAPEAKNTSWALTPDVIAAARERFAPADDEG